jgi:uncharacterized integral membrane protein
MNKMNSLLRNGIAGVLALVALVFLVANWNLFFHRQPLNLLFAQIEAPVGLMLVGLVILLAGVVVAAFQIRNMADAGARSREIAQIRAEITEGERRRAHTERQALLEDISEIRRRIEKIDGTLSDPPAGPTAV